MNTKTNNKSLLYQTVAVFMIAMLLLVTMPMALAQAAPLTAVGVGADFGAANVVAGTGAMTAITGNYTVGAGTNRLLVVTVLCESNIGAGVGSTMSFTSGSYGGQALTSFTLNGSGVSRNRIWVGYLKEAGIAAAASTTLNLNFANSALPTGWVVKAAWFNGIDQVTPINAFVNGGNPAPGVATHNFGANLAVIDGGRAIYFEGTDQNISYTAPAGYTENFDANDPSNNFRATAGSKAIGANGNENPTITQSAAIRYSVTAISLNPAPVAPAITSANATTFSIGVANTFTVTATGFPAPTFAATGSLPSGVTLGAAGVLSGMPAVGTVGVYPFTITASNGALPDATQSFTLTVKNGPIINANGINSVPDTGNGSISNNENIINTLGINTLTVQFDKDVFNVPSGDPNFSDSVVNPLNYKLVLGSSTGVFQTVSCLGGVVAPDVAISVDNVTYSNGGGSGPFIATLNINSGLPLNVVGFYRLYVCGTTSIVDAANVNLALAGDGINPGTDFLLNFRIQASGAAGGGGGSGNNNTGTTAVSTNASLIPVTGFSPNKVTVLPAQPADKAYKSLGEIRIKIPTLGINYPIVGAMLDKNTWDFTWLKDSVASVEGSAYPTLAGNTVLTAHVMDANNNLGPFSDIRGMQKGQKIYIHTNGQVYVYQVQANRKILSSNISTVFKHEEYSWITLVTCEDYNAKTGSYKYRRMVRAVLISVISEK